MNMDITFFDLKNEKMVVQWDQFVQQFPERGHHHESTLLQALLEPLSHENLSLIAFSQGQVVGVLPLLGIKSPLFGNKAVSLPHCNYGGVIAIGTEVEHALLEFAKTHSQQRGYKHLQIRATSPLPKDFSAQGWQQLSHKVNMLLELPDDIHSVGAGNAKKRSKLRSQSKLAERRSKELSIELKQSFGGTELLDDFYSVFSEHMRDLGTPVLSQAMFKSFLTHTNSTLSVVYWDNKPVAAGFLIHHKGKRTSIPWASTLTRVNHLSINAYMYRNILAYCIEKEQVVFDFGRSTKDEGTYRFKAQWGAQPEACYWYEFSANSDFKSTEKPGQIMRILSAIWKRLPLALTNKIGPYIMRQLPA